jgi:hypothetical protein
MDIIAYTLRQGVHFKCEIWKKPITADVPRVQMSGCTSAFPQGALSEVFASVVSGGAFY